jgi:hypothetical protein
MDRRQGESGADPEFDLISNRVLSAVDRGCTGGAPSLA